MAIMPIRCKGVLEVKKNEKTLEYNGKPNPKQDSKDAPLLLFKKLRCLNWTIGKPT